MKKERRFIKVWDESTMTSDTAIYVDSTTGVNYLFINSGYGGGLTPLLGADGKPVISPLPVTE